MKFSTQIGTVALTLGVVLASCNNSGSSLVGSAQSPTSVVVPQNLNPTGPTEIWNVTQPAPGGTQTPIDFDVTFAGNVTNDIGTSPLANEYNPFCPVTSSGCPLAISTSGVGSHAQTTVVYSGTLYENRPPSDPCYPCYHFGLFGVNAASYNLQPYQVSVKWTYPRHIRPIPWYFVAINAQARVSRSKKWAYAEVYIAVSTQRSGAPVSQLWQELGYVPKGSAQPKLTFDNYGKKALYVLSSGIILNQPVPNDPACQSVNPPCSADFDIISKLNYEGSPPPGASGSQFVPLQYPPPGVLKPKKMHT